MICCSNCLERYNEHLQLRHQHIGIERRSSAANTLNKQYEINNVQTELTTGKHADLGRELGIFSSSVISLEKQIGFIDQTTDTNALASNRLSVMQSSMSSMVEAAQDFITQATTELTSSVDSELLKNMAETSLDSLNTLMNVTFKGDYIFSGINTDAKSIVDYTGDDGAAAKSAVQAAFVSTFGFSPGDAAAENITATELEAFIDGAYADLFNDANWESLWSGASDRGMRSKISTVDVAETPTTAHDTAFRELVSATVMIAEFADAGFSDETMDKLAELATTDAATSVASIADQQSLVGVLEERITNADEAMVYQKNVLQNQLSSITDVDAYEAAIQLSQLTTSLEASYSATARIQNLSLLNFV